MLHNRDVPGVVGRVGTLLGRERHQHRRLQLGRESIGGMALSLFHVDERAAAGAGPAPHPAADRLGRAAASLIAMAATAFIGPRGRRGQWARSSTWLAAAPTWVVRYHCGNKAGHHARRERREDHPEPDPCPAVLHPGKVCVLARACDRSHGAGCARSCALRGRGYWPRPLLRISDRRTSSCRITAPSTTRASGCARRAPSAPPDAASAPPTRTDGAHRHPGGRPLRRGGIRRRLARNLLERTATWRCSASRRTPSTTSSPSSPATAPSSRPFVTDTASSARRGGAGRPACGSRARQGSLLDVDHGTYPFVTSSTCVPGGAAAAPGCRRR